MIPLVLKKKKTPIGFSIFPEEKYLLYGNSYLDINFKG